MNIRFMHINKTGGKSIVQWLNQNGCKHKDSHEIYNHFDKNYFYFTVVRDPYNRVASQFFHWRDNLKRINFNVSLDFYVEHLQDETKWLIGGKHHLFYKRYILPCSSWIKNNNMHVFKLEEIKKLENYFVKNYNFKYNLKHINKSKNLTCYKHLYSKNSILKIQEIYKNDFLNFNYNK